MEFGHEVDTVIGTRLILPVLRSGVNRVIVGVAFVRFGGRTFLDFVTIILIGWFI